MLIMSCRQKTAMELSRIIRCISLASRLAAHTVVIREQMAERKSATRRATPYVVRMESLLTAIGFVCHTTAPTPPLIGVMSALTV